MNKFRFTINTLAVLVFTLAFASLAQAQATRTWVSGVGDDANPCSRTAPCKTFAGAISKTALNGEINCLDPGAFGALTITKSITVDCHEIIAGVLHSSVTGVNIPYDSFATPGETRKTVRLRNLNFNGGDTGLRGIRISGGVASANSEVFIEDCMMDGSFGSPGKGIEDVRTGGGVLFVNNTTIRDVASSAISVDPAPGTTEIKVTIANSRIGNAGFGLTFGSNVKASIFRTVITGITSSAVFAVATGGSTQVNVDHCIINSNGTGVNASSANTTIRVSNSTLMNNTTLFTAVGAVQSYGNNDTGGAALGVLIAQN
jgi:hypothetical protein